MNYHGAYDHLRQQLREAQRELSHARTAIRNLASNSFGEARSVDVSDYGTHEMAAQRAAYETANAYWTAHERLSGLSGHLSEALAYDDGYEAAAPGDDEDVAYANTAQMLHEPIEPLKDPIAQSEWVKPGGLAELAIMPGYSVTVTAIAEDNGDIRLSILDDANRQELAQLVGEALTHRTQMLNATVDAREEKLRELAGTLARINGKDVPTHTVVSVTGYASPCIGRLISQDGTATMVHAYHDTGAEVRQIEVKIPTWSSAGTLTTNGRVNLATAEEESAFVLLEQKYERQQVETLRKTLGQQVLSDPVDEEDPYGDHAWARSQETGLWVEGRLEKKWGELGPRLQRENGILVPVRATSILFTEPSKEQYDEAVSEYSKGKERK